MFQQRPLTWLFILATSVVDVVLVSTDAGKVDPPTALKIGFMLGQLGVLALWCVNGNCHRLSRAGLIVLATAVVAYFSDFMMGPLSQRLAIYFFYVGSIIAISLISQLFMARYRNWQMPLIEMFGWTIVVALVSYCIRYMQFDFLENNTAQLVLFSFLALPIVFAISCPKDIRDLGLTTSFFSLAAITASAIYLSTRAQGAGTYITVAQALYFFAYLLISYFDKHGLAMRNLAMHNRKEPGTKEQPAGIQLHLFEPGS